MTKSLKTITVAELIDLLQNEDPDMPVVFSANYGDYHRTEQALPLRGNVERVEVTPSAYSNSGFAVVGSDYEQDYDEQTGEPVEPSGPFYLVIK